MVRVDLRSWRIHEPGDPEYATLVQGYAITRNHVAQSLVKSKLIKILPLEYEVLYLTPSEEGNQLKIRRVKTG